MLCGQDGSIGKISQKSLLITDITDFLKEEITGPATFNCNGKEDGCTFEEPAMNELISSVFGDKSIFLNCHSSECLYYTEVPGYQVPSLLILFSNYLASGETRSYSVDCGSSFRNSCIFNYSRTWNLVLCSTISRKSKSWRNSIIR